MDRQWKRLVLGFSALLVFLFFPVFFQGKTFFFGDNYSLLVPGKLYLKEVLRKGEPPFWNPYIQSGLPFLADISQSILYPSTVLFLFLPAPLALNVTILSHLMIAGLGVVYLAKIVGVSQNWQWLAGFVFVMSQPVLMAVNNIALLQSTAWVPWLLAFGLKASNTGRLWDYLGLTGIAGLSLLGGHPQVFIYSIGFLTLYLLLFGNRREFTLFKIGGSLALTILILFLILLPFVELMQLSTRSTMSIREALSDSVNPLHFLDLLIPNLFSDFSSGMTWGIYWNAYRKAGVYITWFGLLLLGIYLTKKDKANEEKWVILSGILTLVLALGSFIPGLDRLYQIFTPLRMIRNYSLLLVLWPLFSSVMMAKAMESLGELRFGIKSKWLIAGFLSASLLGVSSQTLPAWFETIWRSADTLLKSRLSLSSFHTVERDQVIGGHILQQLSYSSIFFLFSLLVWRYLPKKLFPVIGVLVILDLYVANKGLIFLAPTHVYDYQSSSISFWLQPDAINGYRIVSSSGVLPYTGLADYWSNIMAREPFYDSRFDSAEQTSFYELKARRDALAPNWNMPHLLPAANGFSTFVLQQTRDYWRVKAENENVNEVDAPEFTDRRWSDMGVRYILFDKTVFDSDEQPSTLSPFKVIQEDERTALLINESALPIVRTTGPAGEVDQISINPNSVSFSTKAGTSLTIETSLAYYPGWECVTNKGVCTVMNQGGFIQTILPPGEQQVELIYHPKNLRTAAAVSLIGALTYITLFAKAAMGGRVSIQKKALV